MLLALFFAKGNRTKLRGALAVLILTLAAGWLPRVAHAQSENLSVLSRWIEWADATNRLQLHLNRIAFDMLRERRDAVAALETADDWRARQQHVRDTLHRLVGPMPERTPLNARIMGVIEKEGYRVEKIVFESMPNFYVTGCLFLPEKRSDPSPAILNVIGHTGIAFRGEGYQQFLLNLVRKGFIVFAIDPIGQGERLQYYDPEQGRSTVGGSTAEHSYLGVQVFLSGNCASRYFTWDGIRAIDYLVSRPEVDADRIGVTGLSGGGTQTSYIGAFDERVAAASPACYITGFQRLFESIGPQDAEQNFNAGVAHGIDHGDFLQVRAPKPTLVVATTRDFFSIQGTREVVAESRAAFRALGAEDHLGLAEDDYHHGFIPKNNEATYAFFQKHLNRPGDPKFEEVAILTEEELKITPTGQLIDSLGGETVWSINRTETVPLLDKLEQARRDDLAAHLRKVKTDARTIAGYRDPEPGAAPVFRGRYRRDGYSVEQYVIAGEGELILPVLLLLPEDGNRHPGLIYLHPDGKAAAAGPDGEMAQLVRQGYAVLAPDLSGMGELGGVSNSVAFLGVQTGRSVVGIRAADIVRCARFLQDRRDVDTSELAAVGRGTTTIPLLHAAALDDSLRRVVLVEPLVSYRAVVMNRFYAVTAADTVANALTAYDLPDLAASLAPRPLAMVDIRDQQLEPAPADLVDEELAVVRRAYRQAGAQQQLDIRHGEVSVPLGDIVPVASPGNESKREQTW